MKGRQYPDYWISQLRSVVESIFDDVITKMIISAKIFWYILKTYMMVHIITTWRDYSFSKTEVKVGEQSPHAKTRSILLKVYTVYLFKKYVIAYLISVQTVFVTATLWNTIKQEYIVHSENFTNCNSSSHA